MSDLIADFSLYCNRRVAQRSALSAALQAHPEKLRHPRRQVEVGHIAGHVEPFEAKERHHVPDDDPDQEGLGGDT